MSDEPVPGGLPTGIVLAGGSSRRFGSDKRRASLAGRPLLEFALEALLPLTHEVIVAIGPDEPPPDVGRSGGLVRFARDAPGTGGPLAGLAAALELATEPLAIVVGGDMPTLRATVLAALVSAVTGGTLAEAPVQAAALLDGGVLRPLPCALRTGPSRLVARRLLQGGEGSLHAVLDRLRTIGLPEDTWRPLDPTGASLLDVDTPDDLARIAGAMPPGRSPRGSRT